MPAAPPLTVVQFDPAEVQSLVDAISCEIERRPGNAPPDGLVLQRTSPNGTTRIWGDRAGACGGDHNVFDEVDCMFDGDVRTAAVTTAEATFRLRSNSPLGFYVRHDNNGEVSCSAMRPRKNPADIGPLQHYVWTIGPQQPTQLTLDSALVGGCFGFLDGAGQPLVAALPAALEPFAKYNAVDDAPIYLEGETGRIRRMGPAQRIWTLPYRVGVYGQIVALPEPVEACGGAARAVLLRDMPELGVHGLGYDHPPRAPR